MGFYQLLHTDETHDPNWRPESTLTPIVDLDPTPLAPILPPRVHPSTMTDDNFVFTGVNCVPVVVHPAPAVEGEKADKSNNVDTTQTQWRLSSGTIHTVQVNRRHHLGGLDLQDFKKMFLGLIVSWYSRYHRHCMYLVRPIRGSL